MIRKRNVRPVAWIGADVSYHVPANPILSGQGVKQPSPTGSRADRKNIGLGELGVAILRASVRGKRPMTLSVGDILGPRCPAQIAGGVIGSAPVKMGHVVAVRPRAMECLANKAVHLAAKPFPLMRNVEGRVPMSIDVLGQNVARAGAFTADRSSHAATVGNFVIRRKRNGLPKFGIHTINLGDLHWKVNNLTEVLA